MTRLKNRYIYRRAIIKESFYFFFAYALIYHSLHFEKNKEQFRDREGLNQSILRLDQIFCILKSLNQLATKNWKLRSNKTNTFNLHFVPNHFSELLFECITIKGNNWTLWIFLLPKFISVARWIVRYLPKFWEKQIWNYKTSLVMIITYQEQMQRRQFFFYTWMSQVFTFHHSWFECK